MQCFTCSKPIKNKHYLDGKVYGYNCYRMALSLKYAALQSATNFDWNNKCIALIEIFKKKQFSKDWNLNFQESIVLQWNDCHKLTGNQFSAVYKKLEEIEQIEYLLTYLDISPVNDYILSEIHRIHDGGDVAYRDTIVKHFHEDERLINLLKIANLKQLERIAKRPEKEADLIKRVDKYFVNFHFEDSGSIFWEWANEERMDRLKEWENDAELIFDKIIEFDLRK